MSGNVLMTNKSFYSIIFFQMFPFFQKILFRAISYCRYFERKKISTIVSKELLQKKGKIN